LISFKKGLSETGNVPVHATDIRANNEKRNNISKIISNQISENMQSGETEVMISALNGDGEYNPLRALIVIVDDNPYIREIVKEYLGKHGYQNFILVGNGKTGIEAIYRYKPDLVICDYNMPMLRGDELHDLMHGNPDFRHIPVIFLTAIANRETMLDRKQKGAIAYLSKPIDEKEFIVTADMGIRKYLEFKELMLQASADGLTGLSNKQTIIRFLNERLMIRAYRPLSVIFLDFDHFKLFNDRNGHQVGDTALAEIGKIIRKCVRGYDKAGRYGGEEFLIILPETPIHKAWVVAEKIRSKIASHAICVEGQELKITASFGISSLTDNEDQLCKAFSIPSLRNIYEVNDLVNTDWNAIGLVDLFGDRA